MNFSLFPFLSQSSNIIQLAGIALLGGSLFLYVDSKAYLNFEITAEHYSTPFFLFMLVGIVMTFVGFIGCCGAIKESICLIATVSTDSQLCTSLQSEI